MLTPAEYRLCHELIRRRGSVVSRGELSGEYRRILRRREDNTLTVYISRLKKNWEHFMENLILRQHVDLDIAGTVLCMSDDSKLRKKDEGGQMKTYREWRRLNRIWWGAGIFVLFSFWLGHRNECISDRNA